MNMTPWFRDRLGRKLLLLILAGLSVPSLASAQGFLLPLGRPVSQWSYWLEIGYSPGHRDVLNGGDSRAVAVELHPDLTDGDGCTSTATIRTGFGVQPLAEVTGGASFTLPHLYANGQASAQVTYKAQIFGAHPSLGDHALIPVVVLAHGEGSANRLIDWHAAVDISSSQTPTYHWSAGGYSGPSFQVAEPLDLPANQDIYVAVAVDCRWDTGYGSSCFAVADPQFLFDQAEFDRRMGTNTFPLADYFRFRFSEGMPGPSLKAATPDFDRDLKSDVLWRHQTQGDVWLWPMNGAARTTESYVRTVPDTNWEIRGLGDRTGDGNADILWRNKITGQIYLWPMNGSTPTSETYVATVDPAYDIVGTGDFNGDGWSDILWRNLTNGEVWIWLAAGATPAAEVYVDTVDLGYAIKGVGDLDNDGKADIVWQGTAGDVWVWLMDGTTRLSQTWVATVPDPNYQVQRVADFNGDVKADILWWNIVSGEVWIWTMNGTTRSAQTWVATVPETDYRIVGTGDFNGDGKADILWHHLTRGEVWVWLMDGTTKLSETWVGTVPDVGYQIVKSK